MKKVFYGDLKRGRVKSNTIGKINKKEIEKYEEQVKKDKFEAENKKLNRQILFYIISITLIILIKNIFFKVW